MYHFIKFIIIQFFIFILIMHCMYPFNNISRNILFIFSTFYKLIQFLYCNKSILILITLKSKLFNQINLLLSTVIHTLLKILRKKLFDFKGISVGSSIIFYSNLVWIPTYLKRKMNHTCDTLICSILSCRFK